MWRAFAQRRASYNISLMSDRRYTDEEVQRIFARAAEEQQGAKQALPAGEGTSLARLQDIAREAGLSPELVTQAARELDQPAPVPPPRILGIPIGVARTVELDRKMSDDEWERLVVRLRETFDARGQLETHGAFRTWRNGNLSVMLEPGANGHRVRFRTVKGDTRGLVAAGTTMLVATATMGVVTLVSPVESVAAAISSFTGLAAIGVGLVFAGVTRLPSWRKQRQEQMDLLAKELLRGE